MGLLCKPARYFILICTSFNFCPIILMLSEATINGQFLMRSNVQQISLHRPCLHTLSVVMQMRMGQGEGNQLIQRYVVKQCRLRIHQMMRIKDGISLPKKSSTEKNKFVSEAISLGEMFVWNGAFFSECLLDPKSSHFPNMMPSPIWERCTGKSSGTGYSLEMIFLNQKCCHQYTDRCQPRTVLITYTLL